MPTLADLTLQLSRAITRNEHERAAALAALDAERHAALAGLPGAASLIQRRATAHAQAGAERDEALLDIDADLREAERLAAVRRRTAEGDADQRWREADDDADAKRRGAEDKARSAFDAASLDIDRRKLTPGEKVLARAEARRTMDRAIAAAAAAWSAARQATQDRLLDERRAAVERELADGQEARARADARRRAAERARDLALRTSEAALQVALDGLPGAAPLAAAFAERRRDVDRRFDEREAALRAEFRQARDALRVG